MEMNKKALFRWFSILLALVILGGLIFYYPTLHFFSTTSEVKFNDNLLLVKSGGGNSALLMTDSALVVIDTKMGRAARELALKAGDQADGKPIIVVNTHFHSDHVNGNDLYKGARKIMGAYDSAFLSSVMKENLKPNLFVKDSLIVNLGNESMELYNMGRGHTFDDLVVYLPDRRLLFTGDLVFNDIHPALIRESGCDIDGWINILDRLEKKWRIFTVIPGHGEPGGPELLVKMKQYFMDLKIASGDPSQAKVMQDKYKSWMNITGMSSSSATMDYIRESARLK